MRRLVLALGLAACGPSTLPPEGQVLLHVDTDAPLAGGSAAPLFDRLRIEIFPEGASEPCVGCSREIAVDGALFAEGRASLGIAPTPGERPVVRLRLFHHGGAASGEPRPRSTLDTYARLPAAEIEGVVDATVVLFTDHVGAPQGSLEVPVDAPVGAPGASLVGTWIATADCLSAPGEGEICVPGGAFWMGDPLLELSAVPDIGGQAERLVVVSPFYLDATEVTVGAFRASGLSRSLVPGGPSDNPHEANTNIPGCVYTSEPSDADPLPVNCLTWDLAAAYCASLGKELPTEAQLELAMSRLGFARFVWGDDLPSCGDAVYARDAECAGWGPGLAVPGSGGRDRLALPGGEIVDLGGNLHEWAADRWNRDEEPCWQPVLLHDPRCDTPSAIDAAGRSIRGGAHTGDAIGTAAAMRYRLFFETQAVSNDVGFRCARPP